MDQYIYNSPIGPLIIEENENAITGLYFSDGNEPSAQEPPGGILLQCVKELEEYFRKERREFTVPVRLSGTEFRKKVWEELSNIPYGKTISYKALAEAIGNPAAVRAVGGANHHNPVSIIVPCHRVIGASGSLTGYGGGLWRKEWLIEHERNN